MPVLYQRRRVESHGRLPVPCPPLSKARLPFRKWRKSHCVYLVSGYLHVEFTEGTNAVSFHACMEQGRSFHELQSQPLITVDEAPVQERPRLVVGERSSPRHPPPRISSFSSALVLSEPRRPAKSRVSSIKP